VVFNPAVLPTIALAGLNAFITLTTAADVQTPKNDGVEALLLPDRAQVETLGTYTNGYWSSPFAADSNKKLDPGVGIRSDGNFQSLQHDPRDLVRVVIKRNPAAAGVKEYVLSATPNISLWLTRQTGGAQARSILNDGNDEPLGFKKGQSEQVIWVQWEDGRTNIPDSILAFKAVNKVNATIGTADKVRFYPFRTLVVLMAGHTESKDSATDWAILGKKASIYSEKGAGAHEKGLALYQAGYDVAMFAEDPGNGEWGATFNEKKCGSGFEKASVAIDNAVRFQGVRNIAMIGYSHGGAVVLKLSQFIFDQRYQDVTIPFTAYVDAIQLPKNNNKPEVPIALQQMPKNTLSHMNFYQSKGSGIVGKIEPHGGPMAMGDLSKIANGDETDLDSGEADDNTINHSNIDRDPRITNKIIPAVQSRVTK
jgi:hypothetical protein